MRHKFQVKSTSNLSRDDEFVPCTPPATKKERSLSVNSYLLSPVTSRAQPVFPPHASLSPSPREVIKVEKKLKMNGNFHSRGGNMIGMEISIQFVTYLL